MRFENYARTGGSPNRLVSCECSFFQDNVRWRIPIDMTILRLAYITLFLIALLTVFTLWSQVGGQGHLDLVPWYVKLVLGTGAAFAIARAAAAAVAGERGWNPQSVKWLGLAL